jgi:class 3 adenylate cyclase/TolB-like protein/lipoprotein NlpI
MTTQDVKRKLTAILSADVKGYSRLMEEDEAATVKTLTAYRETITSLVRHHRGRVVDSPGDNLLAEFASVVDAVQCAVEIQELLKAKNAELPENRRMQFRIGINLGDVIEEGARIYGDGVNIASRIEALADPGGICISMSVYNQIKKKLVLDYEDLGEHSAKNISEPIRVYRVPLERRAVAGRVHTVKKAKPKRWQWAALAVAVVVIIGAGAWVIRHFVLRSAPIKPASVEKIAEGKKAINSLAVLPFINADNDPDMEYLSDGITESLIYNLSQFPKLKVRSMNSVYHYKGQKTDARTVGKELNVQVVLTGRIAQRSQDVSISVELVNAEDNSFLWGENYQRKSTDILVIQKDIGKNVSDSLRVQLSPANHERLAKRTTENKEAYQLYLKGRYHASQFTQEGFEKGFALLTQAVELDPNYALAYEGLAYYYLAAVEWYLPSNDASLKAKKAALKALEIDETLPGAHSMLGIVYVWYEWDWEAAEREFKRAFELDSDHLNAHAYYGWHLSGMGQFDKGIAECQRAVDIDPLSSEANWILGEALYFAGRYDEAIAQNLKLLDLNPYYWPAAVNLARVYLQKGQYAEGIAQLRKTVESDVGNPWPTVVLGYALAIAGEKGEAEKILADLKRQARDKYITPMFYLLIHIGLGNTDQAFEWLDKSIQEHSYYTPFLKVFPEYDPLRNDPRYEVLLKKVGLVD